MNLASSPDRRKYKAEFLNRYLFVVPSEQFLATDTEVSGSIPGATRFSE